MTKSIGVKMLSYVLTICMTIAMIPNTAFAQEQTFLCGKELHTHDEQCSNEQGELICQKEEHQHTEQCLPKQTEQNDEEQTDNDEQQNTDEEQTDNDEQQNTDEEQADNNEQQDTDEEQTDDREQQNIDEERTDDNEEQAPKIKRAARAGEHGEHTIAGGWTELTSSSSDIVIDSDAKYYLNGDVTVKGIKIENGANVTLCLNGHILVLEKEGIIGSSDGISITDGVLELCDCGNGGRITYNPDKGYINFYVKVTGTNSKFTMTGGNIGGTKAKVDKGRAVLVETGATFEMRGGEISYIEIGIGPIVGLSDKNSTFTMSGGKITKNNVTYTGFGSDSGTIIYIENGTFEMSGGEISDNIIDGCVYGGILYLDNAEKFTMTGGKISNNTVSFYERNGGGISSNGTEMTIGGEAEISGNCVLEDEYLESVGGGIFTNSKLTIEGNAVIRENKAKDGGGVFLDDGAELTMNGGTISNNTASRGGGVYVTDNATFTMNDGTISGNTADSGGGVHLDFTKPFTMEGGTISGNTADSSGGGISSNGTEITISGNAEISGNTATFNGGGVYLFNNATFTMESGTISKNEAAYDGGGVYLSSGTLTMKNGTISKNEAAYDGGGVYLYGGTLIMESGTISGNTATFNGGGVSVISSTFTMKSGTISKNTASDGGGVYVSSVSESSPSTFTMEGGTISENEADSGGGVYAEGYTIFTVHDVTIDGNFKNDGEDGEKSPNNVYLNNIIMQVDTSKLLTSDKIIGISPNINSYTDDREILFAQGTNIANYIDKFVNENDECDIVAKEGESDKLYILPKPKPIFDYCNGETVQQLQTPGSTKWKEYSLKGWYTEPYGKGELLQEQALPKRGRTYYAYWKTSDESESKPVVTQPLDFTALDVSTKYTEDSGITWDSTTKTLTLHGVTIDTSGYTDSAITLPDGAIVNIIENNHIISADGFAAISGVGSIILKGNTVAELNLSGNAVANGVIKVDTAEGIIHSITNGNITEIPPEGVSTITVTDKTQPVVITFEGAVYSVTFMNGEEQISTTTVAHGNLITDAPTPTKSGYTFKGWSETQNGAILNMNTYQVTKNVTLYAVWQKNTPKPPVIDPDDPKPPVDPDNPKPPASYSVSGTVLYQNGEPAANVSVSLNGSNTVTDSQGNYVFRNVKAGSYVVSAVTEYGAGTKNITVINSDITNTDIVIVKWGVDTEVVENGVNSKVNGLEEEAKKYAEDDALVKLILTVDEKSNDNADIAQNSIKAISKQSKHDFFTVKLEKVVVKDGKTTVTELHDTQTTLQITVDCDVSDKQDIAVYRYCNGSAEKLNSSHVVSDGNYRIRGGNISVYTDTMGEYAIGYNNNEKTEQKQHSSSGKTGSWVKDIPKSEKTENIKIDQKTENQVKQNEPNKCSRDNNCPLTKFTDVDLSAWYHDGVHYCIENGLMSGVSNSLFDPNQPTSRAMIVAMLWRLENKPVVNETLQFVDVPQNAYYTDAVKWAVNAGIISGYDNTMFAPNDNVTREQMAFILYRYTQYKGGNTAVINETVLSSYSDLAEINAYALQAMKWACDVGIINGVSIDMLSPKGSATRAQVAQMFKSYLSM